MQNPPFGGFFLKVKFLPFLFTDLTNAYPDILIKSSFSGVTLELVLTDYYTPIKTQGSPKGLPVV